MMDGKYGQNHRPLGNLHIQTGGVFRHIALELIDRADVTVLVADEIRKDVMDIVKDRCPKLKFLYCKP